MCIPMCFIQGMSGTNLGIWNIYIQHFAVLTTLFIYCLKFKFTYLSASTPILSRSKDPKNEVKIANASTIVRPRDLQLNISHPLDTTLPRDDVTMAISYLGDFLFIVKDHKVNIELNLNLKEKA